MSRKIFSKDKLPVKKIAIFGGIAVVLGGAIALSSCNNKGKIKVTSSSMSDDSNVDEFESEVTSDFENTSENEVTSNVENTSESNSYEISGESMSVSVPGAESVGTVGIEDAKPAITKLSADDVINLSTNYAKYVNKTATIQHQNYMFTEIEPTDLYSVVYLANIDSISDEETAKLIEGGFISDNINENVANSFYFYELYADDTINKIQEGKDNIIDLSLLFNRKSDIEIAQIMNNIMTSSINATEEENYKNYQDTVYFYVEGADISGTDYDFSKSIYPTDRDKLTVGADYTLSYAASCIDEIAKINGVATNYESQLMYDARVDFSNIANVFNGCKLPAEQVKKLTK